MVGSNYWNSSKSPHVLRIQVAHGQRPCGPPGAPFNCCAIQVLSKLNWPGLTAACVRIHSTQRGSAYSSKHPNCDLKVRASDPESLGGQTAGLHAKDMWTTKPTANSQ